ncbi:MAG TPA: hypothetical protein VFF07_07670, partial [Actinomycetota bacterium]|nr:hypothetical protein [Actinomycetota bacterium]
MAQLSSTDEAFRAGRLTQAQAQEITSAASSDPTAEKELLEAADKQSVSGLEHCASGGVAGLVLQRLRGGREGQFSGPGPEHCRCNHLGRGYGRKVGPKGAGNVDV